MSPEFTEIYLAVMAVKDAENTLRNVLSKWGRDQEEFKPGSFSPNKVVSPAARPKAKKTKIGKAGHKIGAVLLSTEMCFMVFTTQALANSGKLAGVSKAGLRSALGTLAKRGLLVREKPGHWSVKSVKALETAIGQKAKK